jgi:hypothetical protein
MKIKVMPSRYNPLKLILAFSIAFQTEARSARPSLVKIHSGVPEQPISVHASTYLRFIVPFFFLFSCQLFKGPFEGKWNCS